MIIYMIKWGGERGFSRFSGGVYILFVFGGNSQVNHLYTIDKENEEARRLESQMRIDETIVI